jgi:hypothetical protein
MCDHVLLFCDKIPKLVLSSAEEMRKAIKYNGVEILKIRFAEF